MTRVGCAARVCRSETFAAPLRPTGRFAGIGRQRGFTAVTALAAALSLIACKDTDPKVEQDLYARVNELAQAVERANQLEARVGDLEVTMAIAANQINSIDEMVQPLPALVARAGAIADEWVDGTLVVRIGSTFFGPLIGYYDTAIAFVEYRERIVLASISPGGDMPYVGDLYFTGAGCAGQAVVERGSASITTWEVGLFDRSSGFVYEPSAGSAGEPHDVLSKKSWYSATCQDLPLGTTATGYAATGRVLTEPGSHLAIMPRYYATP